MNTIHYHRKILNINPSKYKLYKYIMFKSNVFNCLRIYEKRLKKNLANMYVVVFLVNFKMDYKWTRSTRNVVLGVYIHL